MKKNLSILIICMLILSILMSGCKISDSQIAGTETGVTTATGANSLAEYSSEDLDETWDESTATNIKLNDSTYTIDGEGATADGKILTIAKAGTYVLSGTISDGQILVNASEEETVRIVLNGAEITSKDSAAIYSKSSKKTIITLAEGSVNKVSDSSNYVYAEGEEEPDAAIFSKSDLTINGSGALAVNGNYNHGISTKDDLIITNGTISVVAVNDGIKGKDSVAIKSGTFDIKVDGDAIAADNEEEADQGWVSLDGGEYKISAGDDAIHAESDLVILDGIMNIETCAEGLEGVTVSIYGGEIALTSTDDGINAAGGFEGVESDERYLITIAGGTIKLNSAGDGIDSNGSIAISGGTVYVSGPTNNGNGPMDYNFTCNVTGGLLGIAGSSGMAQAPSDTSTQNSITIYYTAVQQAGSLVTLKDEAGKEIFSFAPEKEYQSVLISTSELEQGSTYTLLSDDTTLTEVTISSVVMKISDDGSEVTGGMGGPGGFGGDKGAGMHPENGEMPADRPARPEGGQFPTDGQPPTGGQPPADGQ